MLIILAFHPAHVKSESLIQLVEGLRMKGHEVHSISHYKIDALPVYAVIGNFGSVKISNDKD